MAKPRNRALTEHVPELESTQEPSESRVTPSEAAEGERELVGVTEGNSRRPSWWRRLFG
jgi:hypothetical protein